MLSFEIVDTEAVMEQIADRVTGYVLGDKGLFKHPSIAPDHIGARIGNAESVARARYVRIQYAELPDYVAVFVREQGVPDAVLLCELPKGVLRVVADGEYVNALAAEGL